MFSFGRPASLFAVLTVVLALPGLLYFALRVEANTQDVYTWLPGGISERAEYDEFIDLFGNDDDIIISWDGCTTEDQRLHAFTSNLRKFVGPKLCFSKVVSGRDVLDRLTSDSLGLDEAQVRKRMSGVFFGADGETTGVVARLSGSGRQDRNQCIEMIYAQADKTDSLGRDALRIGGSSFVSVQIHNSTNQALLFSLPAGFLAILVTFFSLRSIRLTTITLSVAGIAALISVAVVCLCGYKINGLLVLMPVIVMVLTLSGGIHLAGYYRHSLQHGTVDDAIRNMMRIGWRPCVLAMLTTSMGIIMLCTSHIEAVRHFGFFTASGLLMALVTMLVMYPSLLTLWPASLIETERVQAARATQLETRARKEIIRRPWIATAGVVLVLILTPLLLFGTTRLKTTLGPENMFLASSDVHRNHSWLEENLIPIQCVEIVATFDNSETPRMSAQVDQLQRIQSKLLQIPEVVSAFSFASLCEKIPTGKDFRSSSRRSFINTRINNEKEELILQRLVAEDNGATHWRIRLGLEIEEEEQYEALTEQIQLLADGCVIATDKSNKNVASATASSNTASSNTASSNTASSNTASSNTASSNTASNDNGSVIQLASTRSSANAASTNTSTNCAPTSNTPTSNTSTSTRSTVRKDLNVAAAPDIMVTGIWPLSAAGRQQLFDDLATSFMLAFLMITPLIMLIVGGFYTGLIAMLPNVFPALLFFGLMGWTGFTVDIGTILTASVGLGIAVDDTLHFLETYVRTRKETKDRSSAVWHTVMHCGRPMLHTSLICSAGLCVFAASQFVPARQFAIAICVLLGLALVADLLLLPALILSPFGKLFDRRKQNCETTETTEEVPVIEKEESEWRPIAA